MFFSSDSRSLKLAGKRLLRISAAILAAAFVFATADPAGAAVYIYDFPAGTAIVDPAADNAGNCPATGTAVSTRTFVVPDTFNVTSISVGLNVTHTRRGDVRAELFRPGSATPFILIAGTSGGGGDADTNFDVMISNFTDADGGTTAIDDNSTDPVAVPFYTRLVANAGINAFYAGTSAGTWEIRVCDVRATDAFQGSVGVARLVLSDNVNTAVVGETCTSKVSLDWSTFVDSATFPGAGVVVMPGVTLTLASTLDATGDAVDVGTYASSFESQTDQLGGINGMYYTGMDLEAGELETGLMRSIWNFSVPVHGLVWSGIDADWGNTTSNFEDYWRTHAYTAVTGGGTAVSFVQTLQASHSIAGDMVEGDSEVPHDSPALSGANVSRRYMGPIRSVVNEYMAGDAFADPGIQYVSIGDALFCSADYGDAPNTYGTLLAGGASHLLGLRELWLGVNRPDGESNGQVGGGVATADDTTAISAIDDEDGVTTFPACPNNTTYTVTVSASDVRTAGADGTIRGYMDWNRDGDFGDAGETSAATTVTRTNGDPQNYAVLWSGVPSGCGGATATFARFRFSTTASSSPIGQLPDGEVEDYQVAAATLPVTVASVETVPTPSGMTVRFTTATESGNAGFRIWGVSAQGKRMLLASLKSQGTDSFAPQHYETTVQNRGASTAIEIEDVAIAGDNRVHGPFAIGSTFGEEPVADAIDWAGIRSESGVVSPLDRMRAAEAGDSDGAVVSELASRAAASAEGVLLVREVGIHRVTYEQLAAAGIDLAGANASRIALVDEGVGVPRHVEAAGGIFGPGSYIEFVAVPRLTLASPVDAYELRVDARKAIAAAVTSRNPPAAAAGVTAAVEVHRPDRIYGYASPNGDPWYDGEAFAWGAPATLSRNFDLADVTADEVRLKIRIWGIGDLQGSAPDHHVIVKLNGTQIEDHRFDGFAAWEPEIDVTGLVTETDNLLEIELPFDTGYSFDYVAFEGFETRYSRATNARSGRFQGNAPGRRSFAIGGFSDGESVAVWKLAGGIPSRSLRPAVNGAVMAAGDSGDVHAAATSALLRPGISPGIPAARPAAAASTEYLIVTHSSFEGSGALDDLVALEESRGFVTEVVTVDKIFAAHSDHASSAAAVKRFLSETLALGNLRYVLLVGADTTDPYDHLGAGSISFVPTEYLDFTQVVKYSPTDENLVDRAGDGLGDVPVGRLPVRSVAELEAVVEKLFAWEERIAQGQPSALLAAGSSDGARWLSDINEAYAAELTGWQTQLAQVDDSNATAVRQRLLAAVNSGTKLVSYVGHSSMGQWDFNPILKWQDAAGLANHLAPNLFTAWGCWNSYYVEPAIESLSARMLREVGVGAAGMIGATTLTTESSHRELGRLFFARVNAGAATVGEAFRGAKEDLQREGGAADSIYGMTLLGDPAMSLPPAQ